MKRLSSIGTLIVASFMLSACSFMADAYYEFNDYMSLKSGSPNAVSGAVLTVYFGFDSASITEEADADLKILATNVGDRGDIGLIITGHTDTSGDDTYNKALSLRRAEAVRDELVELGVAANATSVDVYADGEESPAVDTGDGVAEAANRRVTIEAIVLGGGM